MRRCELAAACLLDLAIGDPPALPHPVQAIGLAIGVLDRRRRPAPPLRELLAGALATLTLVTLSAALAHAVAVRGAVLRILMGGSTLAGRSLLTAVGRVTTSLGHDDLPAARLWLQDIVGRDVDDLDARGIAAAALETLAESLGDGVAGPLLALSLGGCAAAMGFKAISTLDSMIGHIEAPYTWYGRAAARLDDAANVVPARLAAVAIILVAPVTGGDGWTALRVALRDASAHRSPNAGWPEAALAGCLGVRLGGTNRYDGVVVEGTVLNAAGRAPLLADLRAGIRTAIGAIALLEIAALILAR